MSHDTCAQNSAHRSRRRNGRRTNRRGVTIIVVLTLVAITLGLSYAIMRTQGTSIQIQGNRDRRSQARQAAVTGLAVGLRKMNDNTWPGVTGTLSGTLNSTDSYQVTFTTGDASLTPSQAQYATYPYRVTVLATGTSIDPSQPTVKAMQRIQAVVNLNPKQLSPEPTDWAPMLLTTVFQFSTHSFNLELPTRIEGTVRVQGALKLSTTYQWSAANLSNYLSGANLMRQAGQTDVRPFNGTIQMPLSSTDSTTRGLLTNQLGLTLVDTAATSTTSQWVFPSGMTTYQLFPGGKVYTVPSVGTSLSNTTLQADPINNPLGLFYASGDVTINDKVTIIGTLLCAGSVTLNGSNLQMSAAPQPALVNTTKPVQLPALIVNTNLTVNNTCTGSLNGAVVVWNNFTVNQRPQASAFAINGRLAISRFTIVGRDEWELSSSNWSLISTLYNLQLSGNVANRIIYFPLYLQLWGLNVVPTVTIKPETTPVTYHWQIKGNPVFVPATADVGLRWDVLQWTELP